MSATEIKLYDIFRNDLKLDDTRAKIFAEVVQETIENQIKQNNTEFKSANKEDFLKLEMQLKGEIKDSKVEMVKWFVGLFLTLAVMVIGLYLKK